MAYEERFDREDREERPARYERREREKQRKPVTYKYRFANSPAKPEVQGVQHPKLGEIVGTKNHGPCKVAEVFWRTETDADVLLKRIEMEKLSPVEQLEVRGALGAAQKSVPRKATPRSKHRP